MRMPVIRLAALAVLTQTCVTTSEVCKAGDETCSGDETPLMQMRHLEADTGGRRRRARRRGNPCKSKKAYPIPKDSQCLDLLPKIKPNQTIGWWNMPYQSEINFQKPHKGKNLKPVPEECFPQDDKNLNSFLDKTTFSIVDAAEAAHLMYNATKVKGVFDNVPKELRGVFWMKGNGMPEELVAFQYGQWYPEDMIYVQPYSPMMWGYPAGKPKWAPGGGIMYSKNCSQGAFDAAYTSIYPYSISYKFSKCPDYAQCNSYWPKNKLGDMSFAYMQVHAGGYLVDNTDLGALLPANNPYFPKGITPYGAESLEAQPGNSPNKWTRTCMWGLDTPGCASISYGTYTLTRILDGKGNEVYEGSGWGKKSLFKEFVNYMGKVPIIMWTGFKNQKARDQVAATRA